MIKYQQQKLDLIPSQKNKFILSQKSDNVKPKNYINEVEQLT